MGLNIAKGNMYEFITHTWNMIKGECAHNCTYCYMKRWGKLNPVRFDEKELNTDLGKDNFIFVGSSCDMFASNITDQWINKTLAKCSEYENSYFFQSKNPFRFTSKGLNFPKNSSFCATIETNRFYKQIMGNTPLPHDRAFYLLVNNYITIEPIIDFDLVDFLTILKVAKPRQINIGANTSKVILPEPNKDKILELIYELEKFTIVNKKSNLNRILK